MPYNISCRCGRYERNTKPQRQDNKTDIGVWLSLARAPGLGPGGRRFESCHPDLCGCSSMVEHQPSKLDTWVRFPSPAYFFAKNKVYILAGYIPVKTFYSFFEIPNLNSNDSFVPLRFLSFSIHSSKVSGT